MQQQTEGQEPAIAPRGGPRRSTAQYGSDVVVEMLRGLEIRYVALNPGASYRGLHDSLVNFGSASSPEIILCNHEEIAVALAGGYARVTGRPIAVALHNVVGLQHAAMAIFCAYCDRAPVYILGGTGPMDTSKRRPHIDWVHTALVQGNQVRDYVKWDDQPYSVAAVPESMLRAYRIATTEPKGPVYLCFDVELQEEAIAEPPVLGDAARFTAPIGPAPEPEALKRAAGLLAAARWPVIVADSLTRNPRSAPMLRELAELLGAAVVDTGDHLNFPSNHPLDMTLDARVALADADVILGLDAFDLASSGGDGRSRGGLASSLHNDATVIHITLSHYLQSAWIGDGNRLYPVDLPISADTSIALPQLIELCRAALTADPGGAARVDERRRRVEEMHDRARRSALAEVAGDADLRPISSFRLYSELWDLVKGTSWNLASAAGRAPLRALWDITEPEQRAETGRGAGIGYEAAASLGTALAHKDTDRLCISVCGDGGFLMVPQLLWTAANSQIPILYVMFNNRSYFNDEGHQEFVARFRNRPIENKSVGIRIDAPAVEFTTLARSLGVEGIGPISDPERLRPALQRAIHTVRDLRRPALVEVLAQSR